MCAQEPCLHFLHAQLSDSFSFLDCLSLSSWLRGKTRSYAFVSLASHFTPQGKITSSLTRKIGPGNFQGQDVVDFSPWVVLPDEDKVAFLISFF